jgi:hypothetical protein
MNLSELTLEKAKELEGLTFEMTVPEGGTVALKLEEAAGFEVRQRRRRAPASAKREPFALYFLGPLEPVYEQGMYSFRSGDVTFENMFIVPVGRDDEGVEYEAVFA